VSAPDLTQLARIQELLPWYATGTLSAEDIQFVERALAANPELLRDCELVREEFAETIHANELVGAPSPQLFERLMTRVDAEPRAGGRARNALLSRLGNFISAGSPATWRWVGAAAAVVIVVQAGVIAEFAGERSDLAGTRGVELTQATTVVIRFQSAATAADITRYFEANRLVLVAGPLPGGLYRVKLADRKLSQTEIEERVRTLQQAAVVETVRAEE
jgi:anti-sigma-K factor RskA